MKFLVMVKEIRTPALFSENLQHVLTFIVRLGIPKYVFQYKHASIPIKLA